MSIQEVFEALVSRQGMTSDQAEAVIDRLLGQIFGKEFLRDAATGEKEILNAALLSLTAGCNLRCSTCFAGATIPGPDECTFGNWRTFLGAFRNFGGEFITLSGGEPMMNPDFFAIIRYAKSLGFKVIVLTNGTLITKENAKVLAEWCDEVQISIDGPTAEISESVRGEGTFEKAMSSLRELSAYPVCHLSIAMTPTPVTLPVFRQGFERFVETVRGDISPDISIRVSRRLTKGRMLAELSSSEAEAFRKGVLTLCDELLEKDFSAKLDSVRIIPNRKVFSCGLAESFMVRANGDIKVCSFSPNRFGSVKHIKDENDVPYLAGVADKLRQLISSVRVEQVRPCKDCDLRYFCGGGCRRDCKNECGSPNICDCGEDIREEWYQRLVHINPFVVEPLTDRERR